jgi:glycine/D-amino acid oxidase-like deaminating enzyme
LSSWRALFERIGAGQPPLFHPCGVLWLAAGEDPYTTATRDTLQQQGHPVQLLDRDSLRTRFPQIEAEDVGVALFEPDCGVLMARRAVQGLVADLAARGVPLVRARVAPIEHGAPQRSSVAHRSQLSPCGERLTQVGTLDGRELHADAFVFACGPWLPQIFPDLLSARIRPTRQVVIYFGPPAGDIRFGPEQTPAWVDFPAGIYGVPDLEARGVKVGLDRHGPPFDPDRDDRVLDDVSIETARAWLGTRMPAMADAPVIESRVCQYENTATGDFLIDRHPDLENVWIAGGGSGHGFKHAPAVGEHVAALVRGVTDPEPRFLLATKGTAPHRSVF